MKEKDIRQVKDVDTKAGTKINDCRTLVSNNDKIKNS